MARIITVCSNKGGVGKTTTVVSIGAALRLRGYDVLLIDYDGQANVTIGLRVDTSGGTMFDAIRNERPPRISPVRVLNPAEGAGVLDVLPSEFNLYTTELLLSEANDKVTRLGDFLKRYRDKYDVILIDTPPQIGLLTFSALYAADELILPIRPEYFAVKGLVTLNEKVSQVDKFRRSPLNSKILFTQVDKRKGLHQLIIDNVRKSGLETFDTVIRNNVAIGEAVASGVDIFTYNRNCNGSLDYAALTAEYLNGSPLNHTPHGYK